MKVQPIYPRRALQRVTRALGRQPPAMDDADVIAQPLDAEHHDGRFAIPSSLFL